ncbi:unnamed protein product [Didymodactylos carnosus]|uniref:Uncharacterized protein n=1 Tax=Didymodactylos carnosus TaxID=1234261 RepID=A0A8S2CPB3_9BILA|nr:unnamed protein product [Didymodactylos carnosus]CAF3504563.1 unnamed protein product [Didymodactylos carnosus]
MIYFFLVLAFIFRILPTRKSRILHLYTRLKQITKIHPKIINGDMADATDAVPPSSKGTKREAEEDSPTKLKSLKASQHAVVKNGESGEKTTKNGNVNPNEDDEEEVVGREENGSEDEEDDEEYEGEEDEEEDDGEEDSRQEQAQQVVRSARGRGAANEEQEAGGSGEDEPSGEEDEDDEEV